MNERETLLRPVIDGLRETHGSFPERLVDIPELPFSRFDELTEALAARRILLQRFSVEYGPTIYSLFATPAERAYQSFTSFLAFAAPIAGLLLAITVRWWWLAPGVVTFFLVLREQKKIYNAVIYRGALESELGFCFLYRVKQVCLTSPDFRTSFYWRD